MEMSVRHENSDGPATCLQDFLSSGSHAWGRKERSKMSGPTRKLEKLLGQSSNKLCADCGSTDPKWVSLNYGVFICIKRSDVHRSLGVHISKVLSINLDEWTDEQVNAFIELGGNTAANKKYEACVPNDCAKPMPDASIEEHSDFIRKKYDRQQFLSPNDQAVCPYWCPRTSSSAQTGSSQEKKNYDKQATRHRIGHAFHNSWGRKDSENRHTKKSSISGISVKFQDFFMEKHICRSPMLLQSVRTRVIKNNLNPVWNESLMLSIPDHSPPLKVLVYDKDTFTTNDFMGEAEIDIQPLVAAAKAYETSTVDESMQLGKWVASTENMLVKDGVICLVDGKVKQEISLGLQNVERGVLEIELECVPLTQ